MVVVWLTVPTFFLSVSIVTFSNVGSIEGLLARKLPFLHSPFYLFFFLNACNHHLFQSSVAGFINGIEHYSNPDLLLFVSNLVLTRVSSRFSYGASHTIR